MGLEQQHDRIDKMQEDKFSENPDAGKKIDALQDKISKSNLSEADKIGMLEHIYEELKDDELKTALSDLDAISTNMQADLETLESMHVVKRGESLGSIIVETKGYSFKKNPELFFAAIKALDASRKEYGSLVQTDESGNIYYDVAPGGPDDLQVGERLDLSVLDDLDAQADDVDYYMEHTKYAQTKQHLQRVRKQYEYKARPKHNAGGVAERAKALAAEQIVPEEAVPQLDAWLDIHETDEPRPEDLEAMLASAGAAEQMELPYSSFSISQIKTREDYDALVSGLTTEEERRTFLLNLSEMVASSREEIELSELQTYRLQQVELLQDIFSAMAAEFDGEKGQTLSMYVHRMVQTISQNSQSLEVGKAKMEKIAGPILEDAKAQLILNPDKKLEDIPKLKAILDTLRSTPKEGNLTAHAWDMMGFHVDMYDLSSLDVKQRAAAMDQQRAGAMSMLSSINHYEAIRSRSEVILQPEFDEAIARMEADEARAADLAELEEMAHKKIESMAAEYRASWTEQGLSPDAQEQFIQILVNKEIRQGKLALALNDYWTQEDYFNPEDIPADKRATWEMYQETFDVRGEVFEMESQNIDFAVKELLINAPLIIVSGGIAAGVRGALSVRALALLEATPELMTIYRGAGTGTRLALRASGSLAGLAVEGATFELVNTGIHTTLERMTGVDAHYYKDLPDFATRVAWSCATLGLFKASGQASAHLSTPALKGITHKGLQSVIQQYVVGGFSEAATMMLMAAIQEGYYKGDLSEFMAHWDEHLFHSVVSVASMKAVGKFAHRKKSTEELQAAKDKQSARVEYYKGKRSALEQRFKSGAESVSKLIETGQKLKAENWPKARVEISEGLKILAEVIAITPPAVREGLLIEYKALHARFENLNIYQWAEAKLAQISKGEFSTELIKIEALEQKATELEGKVSHVLNELGRIGHGIKESAKLAVETLGEVKVEVQKAKAEQAKKGVDSLKLEYRSITSKDLSFHLEGNLKYKEARLKALQAHEQRLEKAPEFEGKAEMLAEVRAQKQMMKEVMQAVSENQYFIEKYFPGGVKKAMDVWQKSTGHCYLLAGEIALAQTHPKLAEQKFIEQVKEVQAGVFEVGFESLKSGYQVVTVTMAEVMQFKAGHYTPDRRSIKKAANGPLGLAILERAHIKLKARELGRDPNLIPWVWNARENNWDIASEGGFGHRSLQESLGSKYVAQRQASGKWEYAYNKTIAQQGVSSEKVFREFGANPEGYVMTANMGKALNTATRHLVEVNGVQKLIELPGPHAYSVVGYNAATDRVQILNPHNTTEVIEMRRHDFDNAFSQISAVRLRPTANKISILAGELKYVTNEKILEKIVREQMEGKGLHEILGESAAKSEYELLKSMDVTLVAISNPSLRRVMKREILARAVMHNYALNIHTQYKQMLAENPKMTQSVEWYLRRDLNHMIMNGRIHDVLGVELSASKETMTSKAAMVASMFGDATISQLYLDAVLPAIQNKDNPRYIHAREMANSFKLGPQTQLGFL